MNVCYPDIRFAFRYDNPFENDYGGNKLNKLKEYIKSNSTKFVSFDWLNKSRYGVIKDNSEELKLYGETIIDNNISGTRLLNDVKKFIAMYSKNDSLVKWAKTGISSFAIPVSEKKKDDGDEPDQAEESTFNAEPFSLKPNKNLSKGSYDFTNDIPISYAKACEIAINMARESLYKSNTRDEYAVQIDSGKRRELIEEIAFYKQTKEIDAEIDESLDTLTVDELRYVLERCKRIDEKTNTLNFFKTVLNIGGKLCDNVFPNGIKIGNNKTLELYGIGDELKDVLFDGSKPPGKAVYRMIQKYNIHVGDEAIILASIAGVMIKGVKIKTVEPTKEDKPAKKETPKQNTKEINNSDDMTEYGSDSDYDNDE